MSSLWSIMPSRQHAGLILLNSPADPAPSVRVENGAIVEMDGKPAAEFDMLDRYIARHAIDAATTERAMAMADREIARMKVDIHVPRAAVIDVFRGLTPTKVKRVVDCLTVVEMMMALR